jgi:hypothetical protein
MPETKGKVLTFDVEFFGGNENIVFGLPNHRIPIEHKQRGEKAVVGPV